MIQRSVVDAGKRGGGEERLRFRADQGQLVSDLWQMQRGEILFRLESRSMRNALNGAIRTLNRIAPERVYQMELWHARHYSGYGELQRLLEVERTM